MSDEKPAAEAPPKKSKKLLIIILGVVLMAAAGGGYFMFAGGKAEAAAEEKPEPGAIIVMDPITINLADDGHYLRVALGLQAAADAEAEPDGSKALDLTIAHYNQLKLGELSTGAGRAKAKKELVAKVSEAYEGDIYDVYFREFVMQ